MLTLSKQCAFEVVTTEKAVIVLNLCCSTEWDFDDVVTTENASIESFRTLYLPNACFSALLGSSG